MWQDVDFYCERVVPGFGAEPFNTVTGLAFVVVGLWALARAPQLADRVAAGALMLVGLASATQHGWAVGWTLWADILANQAYLAALGILMVRRLASASIATAGGIAVLILVWINAATFLPALAILGRAADSFVVLAVALALAAVLARDTRGTARGIGVALAFLVAGFPFRFLDGALCTNWPYGTHGLWHLCNAASSAVLLTTLSRHRRA